MQSTKMKSSFGWVGGKSKLAKDIVAYMPPHKLYIEVFGGGLSVLYAKEKMGLEVINDINGELINLHRVIRNYSGALERSLDDLFISREIFCDIKAKRLKPKNNIERAAFCYYILSQSFGSKCDNFAMAAKSGRKPKNIYKSFKEHSQRLKLVTIENMSFEKLIRMYDKEDAFFYLDPPYFETESYYKNIGSFGKDKHILLRDLLKGVKAKFLLSYNNCSFVRDLYAGFYIA
jgi:DNA adenine methylase